MIEESAGGVIQGPDGRIAVVNQKGRSWSLPKGHVDPGENPLETARREIREETGLKDIELIGELGSYERNANLDPTRHKRIILFRFRTREVSLNPSDPENPEARWIPIDEVAELLTHEKDKEFFRKIAPSLKT